MNIVRVTIGATIIAGVLLLIGFLTRQEDTPALPAATPTPTPEEVQEVIIREAPADSFSRQFAEEDGSAAVDGGNFIMLAPSDLP